MTTTTAPADTLPADRAARALAVFRSGLITRAEYLADAFTFTPREREIVDTLAAMVGAELELAPRTPRGLGRYSFFDSGVLDGDGIWSLALIEETGPARVFRGVYASLVRKGFLENNPEREDDGHWTWVSAAGLDWLREEAAELAA